ncbi:hypothetical protein [Bifidobacterium castoris]|uniref:Uncharacterized protein n=1 Tax=Bifidobacterium castoris TaxID=2306972 RepID=A0A430F812_9BIFI|nr:hypothetical protein [Bifidobacterium castoris]RSX48708.1 hypothetical protein D2E22_0846 [Bifidobacterium castoris]
MQRIGKYSIITTGEFDSSEADVIILDSNILIDIDKFYYKGLSKQSCDNLCTLLHKFERVDEVDYRYALMETCFRRTKHDAAHAGRMMDAIYAMWNSDLGKIDEMLSRGSTMVGRETGGRFAQLTEDEIKASIDFPSVLYIMYGTNLHTIMTYEKNGKNRGDAYSAHCRWVRDELGCVSAYPRMVARSLFLGQADEHNSARSLLKMDKRDMAIADKAWNSAWDCFFMFVLDGYRMGKEGVVDERWRNRPARAVLVTARDQVWIDSMSSFLGYMQSEGKSFPFLAHTLRIKKEFLGIARMEANLDREHHQAMLDNNTEENRFIETIIKLENNIGVQPRTLFDVK